MTLPSGLGSGAGLVGGELAAGGRAGQHRPARSLHPGRGGRTRLPPRGPLAARFRQTTAVSGNVRPVYQLTKGAVVGVAVAPWAAGHRALKYRATGSNV